MGELAQGRVAGMSGFRQPEQLREQLVLWIQRLDDAIQWDHPVRRFDELLHVALFAETFRQWQGNYVLSEGKPPYHPRDLAGLHLYGMPNRIRSSRQLEAACHMGDRSAYSASASHRLSIIARPTQKSEYAVQCTQ